MQQNQDKETSTDEVETEYKRIQKKKIRVGARFSAPVQTGPGPNKLPIRWVPGLFPGDKAAEAWRQPPTPSSAVVKVRVELYVYSPSGRPWPILG
jgi:hypothetical protein